jgi:hypothetical protein
VCLLLSIFFAVCIFPLVFCIVLFFVCSEKFFNWFASYCKYSVLMSVCFAWSGKRKCNFIAVLFYCSFRNTLGQVMLRCLEKWTGVSFFLDVELCSPLVLASFRGWLLLEHIRTVNNEAGRFSVQTSGPGRRTTGVSLHVSVPGAIYRIIEAHFDDTHPQPPPLLLARQCSKVRLPCMMIFDDF